MARGSPRGKARYSYSEDKSVPFKVAGMLTSAQRRVLKRVHNRKRRYSRRGLDGNSGV